MLPSAMHPALRGFLLAGLTTALTIPAGPAVAADTSSETDMATDAAPTETFLEQYAHTYRFRLGKPSSIEITPDADAVLFLRSSARSFVGDLFSFDPETGTETRLLTATQLLGGQDEQLTAEEKARRERERLAARGIARYALSEDGKQILVPLSGRLYRVERANGTVHEIPVEGPPTDPRFDPTGTRLAYVTDGDLHVVDLASGDSQRLTSRSSDTVRYGLSEFVAQEEMSRRHGYWWSPDGTQLVVQRTDTAGMQQFSIADPMNPAVAPRSTPYPRAGATNADVALAILPSAGGEAVPIEWDRSRFPYLARVVWSKNAPLTILVQNRLQTEEMLYAVDPGTGDLDTLLVERDEAWLELGEKLPRWLPDGSGFVWASESSGQRRLALHDRSGAQKRVLTPEDVVFHDLLRLDDDAVWITISDDPTLRHVARVPLDGGALERITQAPGQHHAIVAEGGALMVLTSDPESGPWQAQVRDARGQVRGVLHSVAERPPFTPTTEFRFVDVGPGFHTAITRPSDFDAAKRYPVIVHVYGGPTSQMVRRSRNRYIFAQWMADQGFVVVSIDGRGTPSRGRTWHRAVKNDLIGPPLEDHVTALRALGKTLPELDLERVGIYGWSFGGYFSAMAAMRHGELFKAGVAGAPVTDWQDYDTHYTERYLGLPQSSPEAYRTSSVLTYAGKLEQPLLIVHGTADDNVYFVHALKMSNALFRAGRHHELLALAGFTHMVPDPLVTTRLYTRILDFFHQHLGIPETR